MGFVNVSVGVFTERYFDDEENAEKISGRMVAIMWLITGLTTPLFGIIIDFFGGRIIFVIFCNIYYKCIAAAFLTFTGHLLIWYNYPFIGLLSIGFALALAYSSVWTCIVYIVKADRLGKAYAILVGLYNFGFTIIPLMIGILRAVLKTYYYG